MNDRKSRQTPQPEKNHPLMHDDIVRIVGDLEDSKVAAILALAPTVQEVEAAVLWAEAESDVVDELEQPLIGATALIYEILITRKDYGDEEHRP
jgi:hypothetical protein